MSETAAEQGCLYQYLENGIHEFIFTGKGTTGLDEFFEKLEEILRSTPPDASLRYLVDTTASQGQASMANLVRRFRKLEAKVPVRARGRTAIIHNPGLFLSLIDTLIDTLAPGQDRTRLFTADKRDEAMAWVLLDK